MIYSTNDAIVMDGRNVLSCARRWLQAAARASRGLLRRKAGGK
jgi:hypothetical protein